MAERCGKPSDPGRGLTCDLPAGHESDPDIGSAHGNYQQAPGTQCIYCGRLTPLNGELCPSCWEDADPAELAELHLEVWSGDSAAGGGHL